MRSATYLMVVVLCLSQIKPNQADSVDLYVLGADGEETAAKYCQETPAAEAVFCGPASMEATNGVVFNRLTAQETACTVCDGRPVFHDDDGSLTVVFHSDRHRLVEGVEYYQGQVGENVPIGTEITLGFPSAGAVIVCMGNQNQNLWNLWSEIDNSNTFLETELGFQAATDLMKFRSGDAHVYCFQKTYSIGESIKLPATTTNGGYGARNGGLLIFHAPFDQPKLLDEEMSTTSPTCPSDCQ